MASAATAYWGSGYKNQVQYAGLRDLFIRASLSEPHIDHDNGPVHTRNNGIYLCAYLSMSVSFTPRLSHPGSRDLCMS